MDMVCPECMGSLSTADGQKARCTVHGGEYRIIYSREQIGKEAEAARVKNLTFKQACPGCGQRYEFGSKHVGTTIECTTCHQPFQVLAPPPMCAQHPDLPAQFVCAGCGAPVCGTCAFPKTGGGHWCPKCAVVAETQRSPASQTALPLPGAAMPRSASMAGVMCGVHPEVAAVQRCAVCQAPVCATCDFAFPGGVHVCPACASKPRSGVGQRRKKPLIWSYVLAVWCSLGLAVLCSGALAGMTRTPSDLQVLGTVLMIVLYVPSIIGTAMAVSSLDRRLSNPPAIWISVIWNGLILGLLLLLCVIGSFK